MVKENFFFYFKLGWANDVLRLVKNGILIVDWFLKHPVQEGPIHSKACERWKAPDLIALSLWAPPENSVLFIA